MYMRANSKHHMGSSAEQLLSVQDGQYTQQFMMTSSIGNIFRFTGPLCGEFTG